MSNCLKKILVSLTLILACSFLFAQSGAYNAYSPYSVYGIGDVLKEGNVYSRTMGGVGVSSRNRRYVNFLNPASVTARDSLSFMADFGIQQNNKVFAQNIGDQKYKSANNTFNISSFVMSFPIYRSSAFMVGIAPFSEVGYDFSSVETNQDVIGNTNNITYQSYGNGGIYQIFLGAGATFWKRLSVGAEMIYYFGTINKTVNTIFSDSSYRSINAGYETQIRSLSGKFGIQYEQRLAGNVSMILGATYRPMTKMSGEISDYSFAVASELSDTLKYNPVSLSDKKLMFGDQLGVGLTIKGGEKWSAEFDYLRSDWTRSNLDNVKGFSVEKAGGVKIFNSSVSQSFRAGFEIVPNRNDIRYYYKRMSYRGGLYYETENFTVSGTKVSTYGMTLGITLPVFKLSNGISLGVDFGQRGVARSENLVRERYATILVGFNLYDIWFVKNLYQ